MKSLVMVKRGMSEKRLTDKPANLAATLIIVVAASILSARLEYSYILLDGLPYREARQPTMGVFYHYHLEVIIPLLGFLAFQPFIYEVLSRTRSVGRARMAFALGIGAFLLGIVLEDGFWFIFRSLSPIPSDPLAHQWIRPLDHTASAMGYARIFGLIIPLWYLFLAPPIVAILLALLVIPRSPF